MTTIIEITEVIKFAHPTGCFRWSIKIKSVDGTESTSTISKLFCGKTAAYQNLILHLQGKYKDDNPKIDPDWGRAEQSALERLDDPKSDLVDGKDVIAWIAKLESGEDV